MFPTQQPFKSIQEQVKARVFSILDAKIKSLRTIQTVVVDENFLLFLSSVEEFENFIQETLNCPWTTVSWYAQGGIQQLDKDKQNFLKKIKKLEQDLDEIEDPRRLLELFLLSIDNASQRFQDDYEIFLDVIDDFATRRLQDIKAIYEIQNKLIISNHLRLVVEKNLKNTKRIVTVNNVRDLWGTNLDRLTRVALDRFFEVSLALRNRNRDQSSMSESPSISSRHRIREELRRISESHAAPEELQKLRQELVPQATPVAAQKQIVRGHADRKEVDLSTRIQSLDALQMTIDDMETQVERLRAESSHAQEQLQRKREKLRQGFIELLRLEKLIEQIEKEISGKSIKYQSELSDIEKEQLRIINDPNIGQATKSRLLGELDRKRHELTASHTQEIEELQQRKEDVKKESRIQAEALQTVMGDLRTHHQQEIEEMERRKMGASPSELLRIEEEMRQKKMQFDESVKRVEQSVSRPQYFFNENGRYYLNEDGVKIYKRDSFASERILDPDGTWQTVKSGASTVRDEKGDFYVDQFGQKIYKSHHFRDGEGEYHLDERGNRVYAQGDGATTSLHTSSFDSAGDRTLTSLDSDDQRRQDNIRYIMDTVGRALRIGLASITLRQPADPINYLANFLVQYRYNEMRHEESNRQLDELLAMREQLRRDDDLWEEDSMESCQIARKVSRFQ